MEPSIIVYRNPGEKWFWEQSGALLIGEFVLIFFITFWLSHKIHCKFTKEPSWKVDPTLSLFLSMAITVVSFYFINFR